MKLKLTIFLLFISTTARADNFPESLFNEHLSQLNNKLVIDLKELDEGGYLEAKALGRHIIIYKRTSQDLESLSSDYKSKILDPGSRNWIESIRYKPSTLNAVWKQVLLETQEKYETTHSRSLLPDYMVVDSSSPETTCSVFKSKDSSINSDFTFHDACSGKLYDAAGRLMNTNIVGNEVPNLNAFNLYIPPYTVLGPHKIEIGLNKTLIFNHPKKIKDIDYSGLTPNQKLWVAAQNNDFINIKKAIAQGASPNEMEIRSNALDYAILGSSNEVITYLLNKGAKPTEATNEMIKTVDRRDIQKLLARKLGKNTFP